MGYRLNKGRTKMDKVLKEYVLTMNKIDDFLEYRYKACKNIEELRNIIVSEIDKLVINLKNNT